MPAATKSAEGAIAAPEQNWETNQTLIGRKVWVRNNFEDAINWPQQAAQQGVLRNCIKSEPSEEEKYRHSWMSYKVSAPPIWVPAEIIKIEEGEIWCRCTLARPNTTHVSFEAANKRGTDDTLYPMNQGAVAEYGNLADIKYLNEASVLHAVQTRFNSNLPYTFAGKVLVGVNPYKIVQRYVFGKTSPDSRSGMKPYYALLDPDYGFPPPSQILPHPYMLANRALERVGNPKNVFHQAIIVNGVSGSGKSTIANMTLSYLSYVSMLRRHKKQGRPEDSEPKMSNLEDALRSSLHLLDTFGCAATSSNSDSTRFGKFVKVYFDSQGGSKGSISNAVIEAFFLDTSQLVKQSLGERNFHIFYQLDASMADIEKSKFSWAPFSDFNYTKNAPDSKDIDHKSNYKLTERAMEAMSINMDDVKRLLAGILNLGNIQFSGGKEAVVENNEQLKVTAEYLGVRKDDLGKALTSKTVSAGATSKRKAISAESAVWRRDTLAKGLYSRFFTYLYSRCNMVLQDVADGNFKDYYIGVLDFPGWEDRGSTGNSLSQLLINYAAERFQKFYNEKTFTAEQDKYKAENLKFQDVEFDDNRMVVQLLESAQRPEGLLSQLEALASRSTGSAVGQENAFLRKIEQIQLKKNVVEVHKPEKGSIPSFDIIHNNGKVKYFVKGLIQQNKENLEKCPALKNIFNLMVSSSKKIVKDIFEIDVDEHSRGAHAAGQVSRQYTSEIKHVVDNELKRLECLFIRCVKPNSIKRPDFMEPALVQRQLKTLNVASGVKFQQVGFPIPHSYRSFFVDVYMSVLQPFEQRKDPTTSLLARFKEVEREMAGGQRLTAKEQAKNHEVMKTLCQEVLNLLWKDQNLRPEDKETLVQFGTTKVFMKDDVPKIIDVAKQQYKAMVKRKATIIQKCIRVHMARNLFAEKVGAIVDVQAHYKAYMHHRIFQQRVKAVRVVQDQLKTFVTRKKWMLRREAAAVTTHQIRANRSKERWKHVRKGLYVVHWIARGFLLRCHLLRYMWAIKTLQRAIRGFLMRNRHKWHKIVSTLAIQALWRGYRVRQMRPDIVQYLKQKKYERNRESMIGRLFATFRCNMIRDRFQEIRRSAGDLQSAASTIFERDRFSALRSCAVKMQALRRMKVAMATLQELRTIEMVRIEQWRIKTLREREALQLAKYNEYMDKDSMWLKRANNKKTKHLKVTELASVVDIDVLLDTSEIYQEGWINGFMRVEQHLIGKDGADSVTGIGIGNAHTVALSESGKLFAWGWGDRGQLGTQGWANEDLPREIDSVHHVPRYDPKTGEKRRGGMGKSSKGKQMMLGMEAPHQLLNITVNLKFSKVSCGQDHCVALTNLGQLFSWGSGNRGQLGHGDNRNRNVPTLVRSLRRRVQDAGCGATHTVCMMAGGSVYTWGGGKCQLGHGGKGNPSAYSSGLQAQRLLRDLQGMSADELMANLMAVEPKKARAVQKNLYSLSAQDKKKMLTTVLRKALERQQGRMRTHDVSLPTGIKFPAGKSSRSCVRAIAVGWNFTVALNQAGSVYCWGIGASGQLGNGLTENSDKPVAVRFGTFEVSSSQGGAAASKVAASGASTQLVVHKGVPGSNRNKTGKIVSIETGARHAAAVSNTGRLYMWGDNSCGQLGLGDKTSRSCAVMLPEFTREMKGRVTSVACGWRHTMAIAGQSILYVWGHTMGYDFKGHDDMVDDETQSESWVPKRLFVSEIPGRFPVRVATSFAQNMSVSTLTIRQDGTETALGLKRKVKFSKEGKSLERDLAMRLIEDSAHANDAEVQYRRGKPASSPAMSSRSSSTPMSPQAQALRSIPQQDIERMGRQQLQSLVEMLKNEDAQAPRSPMACDTDTTDALYMKSTASARAHWKRQQASMASNSRRTSPGGGTVKEAAQERGWVQGGHTVPLSDERVDSTIPMDERHKHARAVRAGQNARDRWWKGKETQKESNAARRRRLMDAAAAAPAAAATSASDAALAVEDSKTASGALQEQDIGDFFAQGLLLPRTGAVANTRDKTARPLDLFKKYKASGAMVAETKVQPKVVNVAKKAQYYGRTPAVIRQVRSNIETTIKAGYADVDEPEVLLSNQRNMGSAHSENFYKQRLQQTEQTEHLSALQSSRQQSTWEEGDALRAQERADEIAAMRRAVEKRKAQEEQRRRLLEEQQSIRKHMAAVRETNRLAQMQSQKKEHDVQSSMDKIKNAVSMQTELDWDAGLY